MGTAVENAFLPLTDKHRHSDTRHLTACLDIEIKTVFELSNTGLHRRNLSENPVWFHYQK